MRHNFIVYRPSSDGPGNEFLVSETRWSNEFPDARGLTAAEAERLAKQFGCLFCTEADYANGRDDSVKGKSQSIERIIRYSH